MHKVKDSEGVSISTLKKNNNIVSSRQIVLNIAMLHSLIVFGLIVYYGEDIRELKFLGLIMALVSTALLLSSGFVGYMYWKKHRDGKVKSFAEMKIFRDTLIDVFPDIIAHIDNEGNILWLNDSGLHFFGEGAIGKKIEDYIDKAEISQITPGISLSFNRKDGQKRILSWTSKAMVDSEGKAAGQISTARDITEQRLAENQIEKSERYLKTVFSSIIDGIAVIDLNDKITDVNDYICSLLGFKKEELIGKELYILYPPESHEFIRSSLKKHFRDGEPINGLEIELLSKSGEIIPTSIRAVLLKNEGGVPFASLGVVRDMREIKSLQENLIQAEKLSSVGELISGVAHELNNPLTAIIGYSGVLMGRDIPSDVKKEVEVINTQSTRCQNIISNLLMFSRKYESKKVNIDLNSIVESTLALNIYDMRSSGIEVIEDYGPGLPEAYLDANRIQQVILNLLQNARHAVEAKGSGVKRIKVATRFDKKKFLIEISDTGIGISSKNLRKIFDPFFTTKEAGKGTGLGLSISYGIVKEHGGQILLNSKEGVGTSFIVELPLVKQSVSETGNTGENKTEMNSKIEKKRILVIDDEPVITDILMLFLEEDGHVVDVTQSAVEGLKRISKNGYDVVFSDVKMPDLDGVSFLKRVREINPAYADKIIFITGDTSSIKALDNSSDINNIVLSKPFTMDDVRKKLEDFFSYS